MKRLIYIVLEINIIAHLVMMLFSCENPIEKVKQFVDYDTISGLMAYDVVVERSDSGMLAARLSAPLMHSLDHSNPDSSMLEFPKGFTVYIYDMGDTTPTTLIRGDYGVSFDKKEMMHAQHNVVVKNLFTEEMLETENLVWNQKTKKLYTGTLVKITSPDKTVYGDSMTANEDFSRREIFGIRATIELEEDE